MREGLDQRRLPVAGPSISDKEVAYVLEAVRDGWYEHANDFIVRFERAFADYLGVRQAVSLPSATSAIHLSLAALGIGPGDEVIVPDPTWIATSAPISYVGATPVFADVDPVTWCLDAQSFEARITPRTKAVIPVDLYGGVPDWEAIRAVAARHGVAIIEDAAEAIGSEFRGQRAGTFGVTGVFSFHGSKTLTTGEGGMLVTDDDAVIDRVRVLRDHGRRPGDTMFRNAEVAFKYKMSGMQAALGLAQLERIGELIDRKRAIFGWYQRELGRHRWPDAQRRTRRHAQHVLDGDRDRGSGLRQVQGADRRQPSDERRRLPAVLLPAQLTGCIPRPAGRIHGRPAQPGLVPIQRHWCKSPISPEPDPGGRRRGERGAEGGGGAGLTDAG